MSDDSEPPMPNDPEPGGPFIRRADKNNGPDTETNFLRLLKRAIRKVKRDTNASPTIVQVAALLNLPAPDLQQLIEKVLATTQDGTLKSTLFQLLEEEKENENEKEQAAHQKPILALRSRFRAGQKLVCKVLKAEPGGYAVIIPKYNLRGFLPTDARLKIGEEVLAQYVCIHNNRILLSAHMSHPSSGSGSSSQAPHWIGMALSGTFQAPDQSGHNSGQNGSFQAAQSNFHVPGSQSESYPSSPSNIPEAERAFLVYAARKPMNIRLRRAIDLILPPLGRIQQPNQIRIGQGDDLRWLITDIEDSMRTGCVKAFCEPLRSRSAVLLFKGRAVGCIYSNKQMREPLPTESSLQMMLSDCQTPDTHLVMYGLPEEVTLAMSALFLGYPVERSDKPDAKSYMDYIMSWFQQKEQTACLTFSLPANSGTLFGFVYKGDFVGSFNVKTQEFSRDVNFVYNLINADQQSSVEASILPPELTSTSARLGYSLAENLPPGSL